MRRFFTIILLKLKCFLGWHQFLTPGSPDGVGRRCLVCPWREVKS